MVVVLLLGTLVSATSVASGQPAEPPLDFSLSFAPAGLPFATGQAAIALVVSANRSTDAKEPFVVRLTVPPELELTFHCEGDTAYDAATRVFTWAGELGTPNVAAKSCPLSFRIAPLLPPGTVYTLKATLTTTTPDPNPANNTVSTYGVVFATADLSLSVSSDAVRLRPGALLTYTFTVTNRGPQEGYSVVLTDQISPDVTFVSFEQVDGPPSVFDTTPKKAGMYRCYPPDCGGYVQANIGILNNGSSATYRLVVRVNASFEAGTITNRAGIESTSTDPAINNNFRDLLVFAGPNADLTLSESRGPDAAGGRIPITIQVSNDGPDPVNAVRVTQALNPRNYSVVETGRFLSATPSQGACDPPELFSVVGSPTPPPIWKVNCALGRLAPGGTATITVVVERTDRGSRLTHSAYVTPDQNDPKPMNNGSEILLENAPPRKRAARP